MRSILALALLTVGVFGCDALDDASDAGGLEGAPCQFGSECLSGRCDPQLCTVPGVGEGPCCSLTDDQGQPAPGACLSGSCTNGVQSVAGCAGQTSACSDPSSGRASGAACEQDVQCAGGRCSAMMCEVTGVGQGACCDIDGRPGACVDGRCTDGEVMMDGCGPVSGMCE